MAPQPLELSQDTIITGARNRLSHPVPWSPLPQVLTQGPNSIPMEHTASSCPFISWKWTPTFQEPQPPCHPKT